MAVLFGAGFAPIVAVLFVFPVLQRLSSDRPPSVLDVVAAMSLVGLALFSVGILVILAVGGDQKVPRNAAFVLASVWVVFTIVTGLLAGEIRRRIVGRGKAAR